MASLNVNSLTYSKILHIKEMMDKLNILALIDTRISPANEKKLQNIWNSKQKFNDIIPGQITEMTFTFSRSFSFIDHLNLIILPFLKTYKHFWIQIVPR